MSRLLRFLNSRRVAVTVLAIMLVALSISAAMPSEMTVSRERWAEIRWERPATYWIATNLSTPFLVRNPAFVFLSVLLFASTLSCTATRVYRRIRLNSVEFEREKAFSFTIDEHSDGSQEEISDRIRTELDKGGWRHASVQGGAIEATKGADVGFWGSIIFHAGILLCIIAAPVSALTVFRGEFVAPEGFPVPLKDGMISQEGSPLFTLPDVLVTMNDMRGQYYEGRYMMDFEARLVLSDKDGRTLHEKKIKVNEPAYYDDYQIGPQAFGYSVDVSVENDGTELLGGVLNLMNPSAGDYFDMPDKGITMYAMLFPDFRKEGGRIYTETEEANNPVLLVRFDRDMKEIAKGLLRPGESLDLGGYTVRFNGLSNWAALIFVKEQGMPIVALGFFVGSLGLLIRFLSNERRVEFTVAAGDEKHSRLTVRGFSKYYPAFLEREVTRMAEDIKESA